MKSYDTKDVGINFRYTLDDKMYFNSYNYFMSENYNGTSAMLAYQGNLKSNGLRYFSINNFVVFLKKGILKFNYGYNYEKKEVLFGNNILNSKDYSHYVSIDYKTRITKKITFQNGISLDNLNTMVKNKVPLYYYAMNKESPTYNQDTIVSNYILEPYFYVNWDIHNKISMSIGARTNIPINKQKQYASFQYSLKYTPADNHTLILSAGHYHNYTQPDYYNLKYRLLKSKQVSLDYIYENRQTKIQSALYYEQESGERDFDFYYTINKTQTLGFEFSISQTLWNYFTVSLSNSTIKQEVNVSGTKYKGGHHFLYFLKPSITYSNPKLFSIGLMYIGRPGSYKLHYPVLSSRWNSEAKAYEPMYNQLEEYKNSAYNRLDLSMSKYMTFKTCTLTLYLSVNNILNTKNKTNELYYYSDYSGIYKKYHSLKTWYFGVVLTF